MGFFFSFFLFLFLFVCGGRECKNARAGMRVFSVCSIGKERDEEDEDEDENERRHGGEAAKDEKKNKRASTTGVDERCFFRDY